MLSITKLFILGQLLDYLLEVLLNKLEGELFKITNINVVKFLYWFLNIE